LRENRAADGILHRQGFICPRVVIDRPLDIRNGRRAPVKLTVPKSARARMWWKKRGFDDPFRRGASGDRFLMIENQRFA